MRAALVAFMVLVSACAGEAAVETITPSTVPVGPPATTSTTLVESTTTTVAVGQVDICRGGTAILWEPGQTHVAICFVVPLSFTPLSSGWRTFRVEDDRFHVTLSEAGEPVAEVAVLGYRPSAGLDAVVDSILNLDGPTVVAGPTEMTMGGWPAVTFDVSTPSDPSKEPGWFECHSSSLGTVIAVPDGPGWRLLEGGLDGTDDYGFAPCRMFRVWVVDVAGVAITLIAAADEEQILADSMPEIERLLDSMTFEAP